MKDLGWLVVALVAACGGSHRSEPDGSLGDAAPNADSNPPPTPATHFTSQATNVGVPNTGLPDGFDERSAFESSRFWTTTDLDGDGFLDIVHSADPAFVSRVWDATGSPYWKVYTGRASGWSKTAATWPVRTNGHPDGFYATGVTGGSGKEWTLLDLDGDKLLDLVQSMDPATGKVWDPQGVPHWKVYAGTGSGFAANANAWRVPASGTVAGFSAASMQSGNWSWTTLDVTGDGKPDLVQTSDPATGRAWDATSAPHWKLFENTGNGFTTSSTVFSVPSSGTFTGFGATSVANPAEQWTTVDLDRDGRLDLVQTADPATQRVWDAAGEPYWKVFRGIASGFDATPMSWRVPKSGLPDGFYAARSAVSHRRWTLVDIDGDLDLDLVQTGDPAFAGRVWDATGEPYWKVFANTGDRFRAELHRWAVPIGPVDGFADETSDLGNHSWFLADIDHDGYRDLVQTANPATSTVWDAAGDAYWKVFRGEP